jgi:para-aminobenzoate synthetase/4-amino-4-deoxychorismate lyase
MDAIKPQTPLIQTNEVLLKANGQWLHFARPFQIIQANALEGVIPALRELEGLINANQWHAAGFLSYEAALAFDPSHQTHPGTDFPYLWFGLYPSPNLVSQITNPTYNLLPQLSWRPTVDRNTYNAAIDRIKDYIADGRTYQVNYTMRLQAEFKADPWNFFLHLAQTQNKYAAYIDLGRYVICSASPELFFQLDGDTITGRPMKGTTQRGRTTLEDQEQARWLQDSEKNRAENVMIVDMIRNDLGRIAKIGSVSVPELFTVERYPTLWQMTSTVTAQTHASLTRIFTALFPCASITGAPKVSTMRIISELETTPRKIYTGSIGYIAPNRKATFNVAIRTALIDRQEGTAEYGVGGGIVWDSTSPDEYEEALLKARILSEPAPQFSLLETLLWTPEEGYFLLEKHLARLLDSADYFDFPVSSIAQAAVLHEASPRRSEGEGRGTAAISRLPAPKEIIESYLDELSSHFPSTSAQRVRLLLDQNGNLTSEAKPFHSAENSHPWKVTLARQPIDSNNVFLFHKTTLRDVYDAARSDFPEYDDVLLYNENGELTEFTIGNLVVEMHGQFYTPPISCGPLRGTFRAHLLETGQVEERVIRVDELRSCSKVFLVNSVRQWTEVHFT